MPQFLVSTTHHLLAVDPESRRLWRIHSGGGLYFGLAPGMDGKVYVARRNSVVGPESHEARSSEKGSILVLDRALAPCDELQSPFALRDVHGIACFEDRLWVTCSFDNMVAIYDLKSRDWRQWYPSPNLADRDRDIHHFNTVRFIGGKIYLIAHNFGPSFLLSYQYPSLQLDATWSLGVTSHDLFYLRDVFATCSSGEGSIVNTAGYRLRTGNFPRGLAATPEGNLLGISLIAKREERSRQHGILRWYTADWHFKTDFVLPRVGMILDILPLTEGEYDLESLEPWTHAEITAGDYNLPAPGNVYRPNSFSAPNNANALQWHASEDTHCWSAACDATFPIVVNPGETRLCLEVSSANPGPYSGELWLDGQHLGTVTFHHPGIQKLEFDIHSVRRGAVPLSIRVPHLWQPAAVIPGSTDERLLGLAVHSVRLLCSPAPDFARETSPPARS